MSVASIRAVDVLCNDRNPDWDAVIEIFLVYLPRLTPYIIKIITIFWCVITNNELIFQLKRKSSNNIGRLFVVSTLFYSDSEQPWWINTYWLRPRETVCFVDQRLSMFPRRSHKTYCFPEVSVNKYFIIYWVSKEKKSTTNQSNMYKKDYLLPDMAPWGSVDLLFTGE